MYSLWARAACFKKTSEIGKSHGPRLAVPPSIVAYPRFSYTFGGMAAAAAATHTKNTRKAIASLFVCNEKGFFINFFTTL